MKSQSSPLLRGSMLMLALFASAIAIAQQTASHSHNTAVPFIDLISPAAARVHGSGFILILDGAGFGPEAKIDFQLGRTIHPLQTVVVNEGEVAAYVPARLVHYAATASITVTNRHRHHPGLPSNPVLLPITKPTDSVVFNQSNITLGEGLGPIVTADFNGDGQPDLAISEPCGPLPGCVPTTGGNVVILLGKHDGTFVAAPSIAVGNIPEALATGDFNGDGKIDLVVGNEGASSVTILYGDGLGCFTPASSAVPVDADPNYIAVGDFNRDGRLDLAVAHASPIYVCSPAGCAGHEVSILLGAGDGTFTDKAYIDDIGGSVDSVTVADVNRDGILDLVVLSVASPYVFVYAGQGDGTFSQLASPTAPPVSNSSPSFALGDVNRDGNLDLVFTNQNIPALGQSILTTALGKGNGLFHDGPTSRPVNEALTGGTLADFNGDGKLDVASEVGFSIMKYDIFLGNGHGTFNLANSMDVSNHYVGVPPVIADFNGDGKLDLATVTGDSGGTVSILLQK